MARGGACGGWWPVWPGTWRLGTGRSTVDRVRAWGCTSPLWTGPVRGGAVRTSDGAMAGGGEVGAAALRGTTGRGECTGA